MDQWLDELARSLAAGQTRRSALGKLGGGLAAVLLASIAPERAVAAAKEPEPDKKGGPITVTCNPSGGGAGSTDFVDPGQSSDGSNRPAWEEDAIIRDMPARPARTSAGRGRLSNDTERNQTARSSRRDQPRTEKKGGGGTIFVGCQANETCCGGVACRNLQISNTDCGQCGNACPSDQTCVGGTCRPSVCGDEGECPATIGACLRGSNGSACVALSTHPICAGLPSCSFGSLGGSVVGCCEPGTICCADALSSLGTSGACCKFGCGLAGTCLTTACSADKPVRCGATCVDLTSDSANCGACGRACPSGQTCCGSVCRNLQSDGLNCGVCGKLCAFGQDCENGRCASSLTCTNGKICPSGCCPAANSTCCPDGSCCRPDFPICCGPKCCAAGFLCVNGACVVSCPSGQSNCGGTCVNLQTDGSNCGTCGARCAFGQDCEAGKCSVTTACPNGNRCAAGCCPIKNSTCCPSGCCDIPNATCCPGSGCCRPDAPVCCPGGCCRSDFPVCCGKGCCPAGTTCGPNGDTCIPIGGGCPTGQATCRGACADLQSDGFNCGACDVHCQFEQNCVAGKCVATTTCSGGTRCASGCCPGAKATCCANGSCCPSQFPVCCSQVCCPPGSRCSANGDTCLSGTRPGDGATVPGAPPVSTNSQKSPGPNSPQVPPQSQAPFAPQAPFVSR